MKKLLYVILAFVICGALLSAFTFANINSNLDSRIEKQNAKNCILDGTYLWDEDLDFASESHEPEWILESIEFETLNGKKFSYISIQGGVMLYHTVENFDQHTLAYNGAWYIEDGNDGSGNVTYLDLREYRYMTFDKQKVPQEFYDLVKEYASKVVPVYDPVDTDGPDAGDSTLEAPNVQHEPSYTTGEAEDFVVPEVTEPAATEAMTSGADIPVIDPGM